MLDDISRILSIQRTIRRKQAYNARRMLACVDVDYRTTETVAAAVVFANFGAEHPLAEHVARLPPAAPYEPGRFYLRELPPLLHLLEQIRPMLNAPLDALLIDGFVWLGPEGRPGLGAHLHQALLAQIPIIGVAKTCFRDTAGMVAVLRGDSRRPLYVTAAGLDVAQAAMAIQRMHGPNRLPTLLKRVDRLCRDA